MEKNCIVVEDNWEYNDEYYHRPEGGGYNLHKGILYTEDEAKQIVQDLNDKHSGYETDEEDDTVEYNDEFQGKVYKPYHYIKLK